jgi:hypothetical protein
MASTDLSFSDRWREPYQLISSAQNLGTAWADLGSELTLSGAHYVGLYLTLDINLSTNARVRLLAKHSSAHADEFVLPIRTVGVSSIGVNAEYNEFSADADQKVLLSWDLDGVVTYGQFQVQTGTAGGTAGQIDDAWAVSAV